MSEQRRPRWANARQFVLASACIRCTAYHYNITDRRAFQRPGRTGEINEARQVLMYLLYYVAEMPYLEIGASLHRDHSTVMHGVDRVAQARQERGEIEMMVQEIARSVGVVLPGEQRPPRPDAVRRWRQQTVSGERELS